MGNVLFMSYLEAVVCTIVGTKKKLTNFIVIPGYRCAF